MDKPTSDNTADKLDEFIYEHLHRFGENNLFRSSLDNFRDTGKPSGSFRASLRSMLEEYRSIGERAKEEEIADLKRQVSNWQMLHDLVKVENESKGKKLFAVMTAQESFDKTVDLLKAYEDGDLHGGNPMQYIERYRAEGELKAKEKRPSEIKLFETLKKVGQTLQMMIKSHDEADEALPLGLEDLAESVFFTLDQYVKTQK